MFSRGALIRDIVSAAFDILTEIREAQEADSDEGSRLSDAEIEDIGSKVGGEITAIVVAHLVSRRR